MRTTGIKALPLLMMFVYSVLVESCLPGGKKNIFVNVENIS